MTQGDNLLLQAQDEIVSEREAHTRERNAHTETLKALRQSAEFIRQCEEAIGARDGESLLGAIRRARTALCAATGESVADAAKRVTAERDELRSTLNAIISAAAAGAGYTLEDLQRLAIKRVSKA